MFSPAITFYTHYFSCEFIYLFYYHHSQFKVISQGCACIFVGEEYHTPVHYGQLTSQQQTPLPQNTTALGTGSDGAKSREFMIKITIQGSR